MGKRRRKRAGFWLKGICLILLVPVFITTLMQRMRLENLISVSYTHLTLPTKLEV